MTRARVLSLMAACIVTALIALPATASAVPQLPLTSLSFHGASTGYLVGHNGTNGVFSWTTNGGATWHAETVASHVLVAAGASLDGSTATAVSPYYDGAFTAASDGSGVMVETPVLSRTVNFTDMAYLSGGRRVAVGKLASANDIGVIASAVDAGPWNIDFQGPVYLPPNDTDPAPTTQAEFGAVDAVPGTSIAWAAGIDRTITGNTGPYDSLIYKTVDGSTWATETAPTGAKTSGINCVEAADSQTAYIGQLKSRYLWRTTDGGTTWAPLTNLSTTFGSIYGMDSTDKDHLLVVGCDAGTTPKGKIQWTSNATSATPTWSTVYTMPTSNSTLRGAVMLDATHWLVVGDNETILRTSDGGATWTGPMAKTTPTLAITSPDMSAVLSSTSLSVEGTSTDAGVGVADVRVRIQRNAGECWNGSTWSAAETWLPASKTVAANGWDAWEWNGTMPAEFTSETSVSVSAKAIDGLGTESVVAKVSSKPAAVLSTIKSSYTKPYGGSVTVTGTLTTGGGSPIVGVPVTINPGSITVTTTAGGAFSRALSPINTTVYTLTYAGDSANGATSRQITVRPYAKVTTPVVPSYVTHTKSFRVYSYLYPNHSGTPAMTFTFQRREKVHGVYTYVTRKTVSIGSHSHFTTRTKCYSAYVKLGAGRWRVKVNHSDTSHYSTTSPYSGSFTIH